MNDDFRIKGRRVPRSEIDRHMADRVAVDDAKSEADKIIALAKREAETVRMAAEKQRRQQEELLKRISDQELKKFLDEDTVKRQAEVFGKVLREVARIRQEFDDLTPWLIPFFENCIARILGQIPQPDIVACAVREGIRDLRSERALTLVAHPDDVDLIAAVRQAHPRIFEGVADIRYVAHAQRGVLSVKGEGGVIRVDVQAQIDALAAWLSAELQEPKE